MGRTWTGQRQPGVDWSLDIAQDGISLTMVIHPPNR